MALLPPTTLAVRDGSFPAVCFYSVFKVHEKLPSHAVAAGKAFFRSDF